MSKFEFSVLLLLSGGFSFHFYLKLIENIEDFGKIPCKSKRKSSKKMKVFSNFYELYILGVPIVALIPSIAPTYGLSIGVLWLIFFFWAIIRKKKWCKE